jgi:8-oxo-dGTP pyrophosphatase MutT (NUDIX family)
MLLFVCVRPEEWSRITRLGFTEPVRLFVGLDLLADGCPDRLLVVDAYGVPGLDPARIGGPAVVLPRVPRSAILNVDPYFPPKPVQAAGGLVVRTGPEGPDVLMIFRRGLWDLPKGKLDPGETIPQCALREVREEVGIKDLVLVQGLGATEHGYARNERFCVKTTYWYQMSTEQSEFVPQAEEEIDEVAWVPWGKAVEIVGFTSIRRHLIAVRPRLIDPIAERDQNRSSSSSTNGSSSSSSSPSSSRSSSSK